MKLNPFDAVENYPQMLTKISAFTLLVALLCVWLVRVRIPEIEGFLSQFSLEIELLSVPLPFGTVVPALLIALFTRIVKLHDRVSDVFRIRRNFDIDKILLPMASMSASPLSASQIDALKANRKKLMGTVFYRYASSGKEAAVIDQHYIAMALDQWAWYWIMVEGSVLLLLTALILFVFDDSTLPSWLLIAVLTMLGFVCYSYNVCARYALQEVALILKDPERREQVKEAFNAL